MLYSAVMPVMMVTLVLLTSLCRIHAQSPAGAQHLSPQTSLVEPFSSSTATQEHSTRDGDSDLLYHSITKRAVFDTACKGLYDRKIWAKLNRACEDCQNVFRTPGLGLDCRKGCFATPVFSMCVRELLLPLKEYKALAHLLRG
ncbi:molt-inhibiting hormone-like [Panulirus ornatus]|uniref:molt-inhibiting hormone-like n=1 Tax=Panulirus ornatus TaxID=150431 RepID=UPI003A8A08AE